MFRTPSINLYTLDLGRLVGLCEGIGFRETFRRPKRGEPVHVELTLGRFTVGIASVDAAAADHGLNPNLGVRPFELVPWNDYTDRAYELLVSQGAPSLSPPHDFLGFLRVVWVADPDGNPIQLVQRR